MKLYSGSGSPSTITTNYDWTNYDFYKLHLRGGSNWGVVEYRFFTAEEFKWGAYEGTLNINIYGGSNSKLIMCFLKATSYKTFSLGWHIYDWSVGSFSIYGAYKK